MKDIKFRAWDGHNNIMKYYTLEELTDQDKFSYDTEYEAIQSGYKNWKWTQCTGLKGKNGEDIYKGDIVSMHQFLFEGVEVEKMISGVIGWMEYGLTLKQIRNEYVQEYCGYDAGEGEIYLNSFYGLHEDTFEIIGNIYENPELINK